MWKYVRCRIRETCDRAYSILDIGKNWSCGTQQIVVSDASDLKDQGPKCRSEINKCDLSWFLACHRTKHSSKNKGYTGRKRIHEKEQESTIQHDLFGAITWSGAIICGWYASQLLCLHRRQYVGDFKRNYNILTVPTRALHNNAKSYVAFASPVRPPPLSEITLKEKFTFDSPKDASHSDFKAHAVEISNENEGNPGTSRKQSVQDAVGDLVTFLGDIEYKMGVQSIASGHFREAVTHLKLATNHNHIGATFNLGLCYEKGLGVPKNLRRAMECYQIASAKGHPKAIYNLGVFYAQGLGGLEQDYNAAKQCFITAANLGQNEAKIALELDSTKHHFGTDPALSKIEDSYSIHYSLEESFKVQKD